MVINLYGWQGAATNGKSRKKTDELITAAQQEFDTTGIGPKIMLGDFNTDNDSSPAMKKLRNDQGWTVGAFQLKNIRGSRPFSDCGRDKQ